MSAEPAVNLVLELAPKDETPFQKTVSEIYRIVTDNIPLVGGMDVAAEHLGVARGDLRRALDRSGRYLAVEHVMAFTERLAQRSQETAMRIGSAFCRPMDALVMPRVQLTAAEQARRYKQMLDAMSGAAGVDLAKKALETP